MNLFLYLFSCFCGILIGVLLTLWYCKSKISESNFDISHYNDVLTKLNDLKYRCGEENEQK